MNLSKVIARRIVKGWQEYEIAKAEKQHEYYKRQINFYERIIEERKQNGVFREYE